MSQIQIQVPSVRCQHGKSWAKKVTSVSACPKTGHDYDGMFLAGCGKLDYAAPGDVVVCGGFDGSLKNGQKTVDCFVVGPNGLMVQWHYIKSDQWAIKLADEIRELLAMVPEERIRWAAGECVGMTGLSYSPVEMDVLRKLAEPPPVPVDAPAPVPSIPWEGELPAEILIGGILYRRV